MCTSHFLSGAGSVWGLGWRIVFARGEFWPLLGLEHTRGEPAPVPALGWGHLLLSPLTLSSAQLLMLCWLTKAKETTSVSVRSWYFPFCLCQEWRKVERKESESHFHLKVSLTNPPGNGWGCYNHLVGLQSPALNLEGTFLLGSSSTFCLSLLSIWQPLRLRDSSLLIIPGSRILNFYGLRFAAPEPQYITCTVAVEWELQQGCMSFSKWII